MADKKYSENDVVKAWSKKAGRDNQYDVRVVESEDGVKQTQLIDKDTGSLTVAVDGEGSEALKTLVERAGDVLIDTGVDPKESVGEDSKVQKTSRGVVATPTQPEALEPAGDVVEVDNSEGKASVKQEGKTPATRLRR